MLLIVAIDKHAPLRTKRVKQSDLPPWITEELIFTMNLRDTHKKNKDGVNYKITKNQVSGMVDKAKEAYFDKLIQDKKDTATLWRAINTLTNKSKKTTNTSTNVSPGEFNQHFL